MLKALHWGSVCAVCAAFAAWFGIQQVQAVGPEFARNAPIVQQLPASGSAFLVLLALYLLLPVRNPGRYEEFPLSRVAAFATSVVLAMFVAPFWGGVAYAVVFVAFWILRVLSGDWHLRTRRILADHVVPFAALAVSYAIFLPAVSPLYLYHSASRSFETYLSASSYAIRNFVAAHSFSLSAFSHTFWGMIQDLPTALTSPILGLLGLLNIYSIWEASGFFKGLTVIFFAGYVFAAYFFFLMLREFGVRWSIALATAFSLFVGNQFYLNMVSQDMGWAGCSFAALTASLWLLAMALRRDSFRVGAWSGVALASQFYVVAPHPEMTIYAVVIYILIALSCLLLSPTSTRMRGFMICVVAGGFFTLISFGYLVPMLAQLATGSLFVLGEDTVVPRSFAFQIPGLTFYVALLAVCSLLEVTRWIRFGSPRPVLLASLIIAGSVLVLAIPGVPTDVRAFFGHIGWTVHLQPYDRLLAYMGFAALIVAALGLDAAISLVPTAWSKQLMIRLIKEHRPFAGSAMISLAELAAFVVLVVVVPWQVGSRPSVAIIDGSLWGVRESIQALLANSLAETDRRASVPYLRSRLLDFEAHSKDWDVPMMASVRKEYDSMLASFGAKSASQLPPEKVREFALAAARRIDDAYASIEWLDDIPENVDRYLVNLDDPYVRVMGVLGEHSFERQKGLRSFLSVGRNVAGGHNNSMMMDTRSYIGYPSVQALYIYPRDFLASYRPIVQQGNYFINGERPPWHYESRDVIGNEFRKLLAIAGVGAYLMLPDAPVSEALSRPAENLALISAPPGGRNQLVLLRDRNAYDTAYLARVVAAVPAEQIEKLADASRRFFSQRLSLDRFREILDPAAEALLAMPQRHDAIVEVDGTSGSRRELIAAGQSGDGPAARGGKVEIVGVVGPRVGLRVQCPDPQCLMVYNLAALPGWQAYVDKQARPILRANYGFISVEVPKGSHFVSLFYQTPGQTPSEWLSLLALLGMLIWQRREGTRASG